MCVFKLPSAFLKKHPKRLVFYTPFGRNAWNIIGNESIQLVKDPAMVYQNNIRKALQGSFQALYN